MASPYESVSVTNYNANPPSDDGSEIEGNRVKWATIKTKLTDMLNTAIASMNTNVLAAFAKVDAGVTSTSISYQVLEGDQGKLVRATASGITITTPSASGVGAPFVFGFLNDSGGDITYDGSGSQTIDGDATITVPAGAGGRMRTDGSNWFTEGQNFQRTQVDPQGYLTPLSGTPIITPDVQSAAVYYTPFVGDLIPIPDGTNFTIKNFSELTLTLVANHTANTIYDVFVFDNAGASTLVTGPAWGVSTEGAGARGTGAGTTQLSRLKGLFVNTNAITVRNGSTTYSMGARSGIYVGTIQIDAVAGQVSCFPNGGQNRRWGVWNAYNRRKIRLRVFDATGSWFGSASNRPVNNTVANNLRVLCGLQEERVSVLYEQFASISTSAGSAVFSNTHEIRIGENSTVAAAQRGRNGTLRINSANAPNDTTVAVILSAEFYPLPFIGINNYTAVEGGSPSPSLVTVIGGEANMNFMAEWMG